MATSMWEGPSGFREPLPITCHPPDCLACFQMKEPRLSVWLSPMDESDGASLCSPAASFPSTSKPTHPQPAAIPPHQGEVGIEVLLLAA